MKELGILLDAGVSVEDALECLGADESHERIQKIFTEMKNRYIESGKISDALPTYSVLVPEFVSTSLQQAENNNRLAQGLITVGDYLILQSPDENSWQSLRSSLFYQASVLMVLLIISAIILIFVIPNYTVLFHSFGENLPQVTQLAIDLSAWLQQYWILLVASIVVVGFLARVAWRKSALFHRVLQQIPVFPEVIASMAHLQIIRSVQFLMNQGYSKKDGILKSIEAVTNPLYKQSLALVGQDINSGLELCASIRRQKLLPAKLATISFIDKDVCVESILDPLADSLSQKVSLTFKTIEKATETGLTVLMAMVVVFFVIAFYLPIFKMGELL